MPRVMAIFSNYCLNLFYAQIKYQKILTMDNFQLWKAVVSGERLRAIMVILFFFSVFFNWFSQINIELNISVAISLIVNITLETEFGDTNWFIVLQPSPFWHSESQTQTNSAPFSAFCALIYDCTGSTVSCSSVVIHLLF
jgi:hypothetical protein